jgi:ring-1,2-phenylacetyl-CoA epoxidase subunit PaaE
MFSLFKKKKNDDHKSNDYLSLKVRQIVTETPDAVTIYFEQPEPYLDYKAGQFITIILDIEGKEVRRSYSLCTSPFVDPYPGVTVKRVAKGLVSNYLIDKLRPGKTVEIMKPMGNFTTTYHSQNQNHYVMIAAGSGVTPLMGIAKSVLINEPKSKVTMLYCSRSEEQIIFKEALASLSTQYGERFEVIHNLTKPSAAWTGAAGRLDKGRIGEILSAQLQQSDIRFFICGPEGLMQASLEVLQDSGVPKDRILTESFYTDLAAKEQEMAAKGLLSPALTREVEVQVEGQIFKFEVSPDKTILEAGLDSDVDMPYSCQSGLCTACRGRLISGQVDMIEDAGLSDGEKAQGYILCCSSKPASADVKIVIE